MYTFHITNLKLFLKNFMVPFYRWGSTASMLQSRYEKDTVYFFTIKFPEIPGTHSGSCVKDTKDLV